MPVPGLDSDSEAAAAMGPRLLAASARSRELPRRWRRNHDEPLRPLPLEGEAAAAGDDSAAPLLLPPPPPPSRAPPWERRGGEGDKGEGIKIGVEWLGVRH